MIPGDRAGELGVSRASTSGVGMLQGQGFVQDRTRSCQHVWGLQRAGSEQPMEPMGGVIDSKKHGRAGWGALEAGHMAESGAPSGGLTAG